MCKLTPSSVTTSRRAKQASKSTPSMAVSRSMARWPAQLHDGVLSEVSAFEAERTKAEGVQRGQQTRDVVRGRPHPEIDVAGIARVAVCGQRKTADNQILNAVGGE